MAAGSYDWDAREEGLTSITALGQQQAEVWPSKRDKVSGSYPGCMLLAVFLSPASASKHTATISLRLAFSVN
jgi:hypothetical protein